jgi:hypothetical protein
VSSFEMVHHQHVTGKLACFDRLIFKGHLTGLFGPGRFKAFLASQGVLLKVFAPYVKRVSESLKAHAQRLAADAGRPYIYLEGAMTKAGGLSKEDYVRAIAERDGISKGLIAVLATVEPCRSFDVRGNRATQMLEVIRRARKCLHFYFYYLDPRLGLIHVRLQGWFPFEVQVWVNGHYALAKALDARGIGYAMNGNAFARINDLPAAQRLADSLAARSWPRLLTALARPVNPMLTVIEQAGFGGYYWVVDQSEVSTDVIFRSRPALEQIVPAVFDHATTAFGSEDVLRFLGRKLHPALLAEVGTSTRRRPEGWRVRHRLGRNSIKVYDKGNCLRVETTINDPSQLRAWRVTERLTGTGSRRRLTRARELAPVRKGVASLRTIYQAGKAANERYLDALAAAACHGEAVRSLDDLCRPKVRRGRRHPRFSPLSARDLAIFRAVLAGEHAITGFANRDLARRMHPRAPAGDAEAKRRCASTSRLIAKLRGHGLIQKIPKRRRYRLTRHGQRLMTAILLIHDRDIPGAYAAAA